MKDSISLQLSIFWQQRTHKRKTEDVINIDLGVSKKKRGFKLDLNPVKLKKTMASNFEITIDKTSDGFGLKLTGDFDATSAYELIYAIKKLPEKARRLDIYTNDLKNINFFGLDVFHRIIKYSGINSAKIVFNGKHALQLSNDRERFEGRI